MGLKINFNKTEFIAINSDQGFHIHIEKMLQLSKLIILIFGCYFKQER